jgi:hypothetical protein
MAGAETSFTARSHQRRQPRPSPGESPNPVSELSRVDTNLLRQKHHRCPLDDQGKARVGVRERSLVDDGSFLCAVAVSAERRGDVALGFPRFQYDGGHRPPLTRTRILPSARACRIDTSSPNSSSRPASERTSGSESLALLFEQFVPFGSAGKLGGSGLLSRAGRRPSD